MIIKIKIIPNSSRNEIVGYLGDVLRIKIHAQPENGKANEELIKYLSKQYKIPKDQIKIVRGFTKRLKLIELPEGIYFPIS